MKDNLRVIIEFVIGNIVVGIIYYAVVRPEPTHAEIIFGYGLLAIDLLILSLIVISILQRK